MRSVGGTVVGGVRDEAVETRLAGAEMLTPNVVCTNDQFVSENRSRSYGGYSVSVAVLTQQIDMTSADCVNLR